MRIPIEDSRDLRDDESLVARLYDYLRVDEPVIRSEHKRFERATGKDLRFRISVIDIDTREYDAQNEIV